MINFGERSEEEGRREWPELMAIVERKVKPSDLFATKKCLEQTGFCQVVVIRG